MAPDTRSAPNSHLPPRPLPRSASTNSHNAAMPLTRRSKSAFPLITATISDTSPLPDDPSPSPPDPPPIQKLAKPYNSRSSSSLALPNHSRRPSRLSSSADLHDFSTLSRSDSVSILLGTPEARRAAAHSRSSSRERLTVGYIAGAVGSAVESLLRANKSTRKFVTDRKVAMKRTTKHVHPDVLKVILFLFLFLFLLIFTIVKWLFGASNIPLTTAQHTPYETNLRRIRDGRVPEEYWPSAHLQALAMKPPVPLSKTTVHDLKRIRSLYPMPSRPLFRPSKFPLKTTTHVTVIAACRDRTAFLQSSLPSWLNAISDDDEIVMVDWGTRAPDHVPLDIVAKDINDKRISVITVQDPGSWVLSRAYNLAISLARGQWILKLDCDVMLAENFFETVQLPEASDPQPYFYRYFWEHAREENEQHLNGILLARSEHLAAVSGYDERIATYGWDDSDLYARLQSDGVSALGRLQARDFPMDSMSHIKHQDSFRGANQKLIVGPTLETQVNSRAVAALRPWTIVAPQEKTEYDVSLLSRDGRYSYAQITKETKSVLEQISPSDQQRIIEEAKNILLHDIYGFPWSVLSEINRSRSELVRSLAILGRSTHWRSANGFIFAEVGGSVSERLLGMASAIALAITYERPLFLAWSSGSREDPTPRVTDFFDVDSSGIIDSGNSRLSMTKKGTRVYQIGRWKCRFAVDVCAKADSAFKLMSEFRSGGHRDEEAVAQNVVDVLKGRVAGKRNVLLRLEGSFPLQTEAERVIALKSLTPSHSLSDRIRKFGDLSNHLGVYIGSGVRAKGLEAMARRLEAHSVKSAKYFVTGAVQGTVVEARKILQNSAEVASAVDGDLEQGGSEEIRETIREIADLYALSMCKDMVNDGRPPTSVLELTGLWRQAGSGHW